MITGGNIKFMISHQSNRVSQFIDGGWWEAIGWKTGLIITHGGTGEGKNAIKSLQQPSTEAFR